MNKADMQRALKTSGASPLTTVLVCRKGDEEHLATLWTIQEVRYDPALDRILIEIKD